MFERSGRQVVLTPAAENLLPYAEKILADVTEARVRMEEAHGGTVGIVRIEVIATIAAHFLPAVFKEFKSSFPQVNVLLREESTTPLLTGLPQSGEIDLNIAPAAVSRPQAANPVHRGILLGGFDRTPAACGDERSSGQAQTREIHSVQEPRTQYARVDDTILPKRRV